MGGMSKKVHDKTIITVVMDMPSEGKKNMWIFIQLERPKSQMV